MERLVLDQQMDPLARQRQAALSVLEFLYAPLTVDDVGACLEVFVVPPDTVPSWDGLIAAELDAWRRSPSSNQVWLCPAWTGPGPELKIDHNLLTRSDWAGNARILLRPVASHNLWLVRGFCDLFLIAEEIVGDVDLSPLVSSIVRHLKPIVRNIEDSSLANHLMNDEMPDSEIIEQLRESADDSYSGLSADESMMRDNAATVIDAMTEERRLFGLT